MGNNLVKLVESSIKEIEEQDAAKKIAAEEKKCECEGCEGEDCEPCESCSKKHDDKDELKDDVECEDCDSVDDDSVCEDCDDAELAEYVKIDEEIKDLEEKILGLHEVLKLKKTSKADRIKAKKNRRSAAGKMAKRKHDKDPKVKRAMAIKKKMKSKCDKRSTDAQKYHWDVKKKQCVKSKERRAGS